MKKLNQAFGHVLRELRTAQKISQEKLALESELDRTYISMLERGVRQPSLETIFQLGAVLKCSPSQMIADVEKLLKRGAEPAKKPEPKAKATRE